MRDLGKQPSALAAAGEYLRVIDGFVIDREDLASAQSVRSLGIEVLAANTVMRTPEDRKALARTSHTPGRTQELIFFSAGGDLTIVDMPGYGYAAAAKTKVAAWTELIHAFLRGRANLARVYLLVDSRHGLKPVDDTVLDTLGQAAVSHEIVLTKADQVKPAELAARIEGTRSAIAKRPAAFPDVLVTSARTGEGMPALRAAIARLAAERRMEGR